MLWFVQALQDILDDDDDIGSMYLSRKARAKGQASRAQQAPNGAAAMSGGGDDEVLVARAEDQVCPLPELLNWQTWSCSLPVLLLSSPLSSS